MNWFKKVLLKTYIFFHTSFLRIAIGLSKAEDDIMKTNPDISESGKKNIRQQHRNPVLEKMLQGQRDEQYVKDFYEVLRKADHFLKTASPEKIEMAASKHGMSLGKKDKAGRRYDHFGFFDPKHKNYGKTLAEAMEEEVKQKTTKDDDYPIEFMFDNKPIEHGFSGSLDELKQSKSGNVETGIEIMSEVEKAKIRKFPMTVVRDNIEAVNKIEKLTRFLHVKTIGSDMRIIEFFIPKHFKLKEHIKTQEVVDELTAIKQVWIKDEYDGRYGYKINSYYKYLDFDDHYDVLKFKGSKIIDIN